MRKLLTLMLVASTAALFAGCGGGEESSSVPEIGNETVSVSIAPGETVSKTITVDLPDPETGDVGVDVMWLVDLSGSFDDDLGTWQNSTREIVNTLSSRVADLRVGLASFVDAPCDDFGSIGDYGYKLNLPVTANFTAFEEAVNSTGIYYGGDWRESQLEAMYQAITGEGVTCNGTCEDATINATVPGWGDKRIHLLIVSTDAPFHRPTDIGWYGTPYPYPANVTDVINAAEEEGVSIHFLYSGKYSVENVYAEEPATGEIANATIGSVSILSSDSSEIVERLSEIVNSTVSSATISIVPSGDTYGLVAEISPSELTAIDLTTTDKVTFTITFTAPEGTTLPSSVDFDLVVKVEGSPIYTIPVHVVLE